MVQEVVRSRMCEQGLILQMSSLRMYGRGLASPAYRVPRALKLSLKRCNLRQVLLEPKYSVGRSRGEQRRRRVEMEIFPISGFFPGVPGQDSVQKKYRLYRLKQQALPGWGPSINAGRVSQEAQRKSTIFSGCCFRSSGVSRNPERPWGSGFMRGV